MLLTALSTANLPSVADEIIAFAGNSRTFLFYGEMGAGKTTLIKALCNSIGIIDKVTSPTFSIVNEYISTASKKIYHFDFYRLKNQAEALDMGYEEYFYSDEYCFIEWPEMIPDLLPLHYIKIKLDIMDENSRQIIIEKI